MEQPELKILALFGKSGAGKDTIQNLILEAEGSEVVFNKIISHTTRPRRENEMEGWDYHYIDRKEFTRKLLNEEFIEAKEFNQWYYAASVEALDPNRINIGVFTPSGIYSLFEVQSRFNLKILPIYVRVSDKTRLLRALNRENDPDVKEIIRRYAADEVDFSTLDFDYCTVWNEVEPMDENDTVFTIVDYCKDFFV